jgi:hypothetical protein
MATLAGNDPDFLTLRSAIWTPYARHLEHLLDAIGFQKYRARSKEVSEFISASEPC